VLTYSVHVTGRPVGHSEQTLPFIRTSVFNYSIYETAYQLLRSGGLPITYSEKKRFIL